MIKHATASTFVFREFDGGWRLGLIEHPRLGRHMVVGGHVERDETYAEAAAREALEESGYEVRLLPNPTAASIAPWWTHEFTVPADSQLDEPHVHVDHQYVAVAESPPVSEPAHPFGWFSTTDLDQLSMFEDTRQQAQFLLPRIAGAYNL